MKDIEGCSTEKKPKESNNIIRLEPNVPLVSGTVWGPVTRHEGATGVDVLCFRLSFLLEERYRITSGLELFPTKRTLEDVETEIGYIESAFNKMAKGEGAQTCALGCDERRAGRP
jgi:hypothetical protein